MRLFAWLSTVRLDEVATLQGCQSMRTPPRLLVTRRGNLAKQAAGNHIPVSPARY
jgi:hypothetical protein